LRGCPSINNGATITTFEEYLNIVVSGGDDLARGSPSDPSINECREQVRRVALSAEFKTATTLQMLLQYLTEKTISGSLDSLKEYTIGVEALGRKLDFDPKLDTIVRVQIHRLRVKLKEYYELEGSRDPILIQFPKGRYVPTFEWIAVAQAIQEVTTTSQPELGPETEGNSGSAIIPVSRASVFNVFSRKIFLLLGCAIAIAAAGYWLGNWRAENRLSQMASALPPRYDDAVESFWARFLGSDRTPVIAYPDAVFLLDDSNDLFWFSHGATDSRGALVDPHIAREVASPAKIVAQGSQLYYENGYTGTGELESAAMLTRLFGHMGIEPIVKSSRDITPDDLSQHNVILLGSPFQNPAVAQLLTAGDFSFINDGNHRAWGSLISNENPKAGEATEYRTERDRISKVLLADYSLITISPGEVPTRRVAVLGGLDTKGTQGAALFVTSERGIDQLNKAIDQLDGGQGGTSFEALLRVRLAKGYQVLGADLISVHPIVPKSGATGKNSPRP
jgi:hypothetical protein